MAKKLQVAKHPVAPLLCETIHTMKDHKDYAKQNLELVTFPKIGSPKLDGLRCLIIWNEACTREMRLFPNQYVQSFLTSGPYEGLDSELIVGPPTPQHSEDFVYNRSQSGVMSEDGEPDFTLWVFDYHDYGDPDSSTFGDRLHQLQDSKVADLPRVKLVPQRLINNLEELLAFEQEMIELGFEGIVLRDPHGVYRPVGKNGKLAKENRPSFKHQICLKLKRFVDDEAIIIGFTERMHNANEATVSALGHTERSSHKENKIGRGDLGALLLRNRAGQEFPCGTGFSDDLRKQIYDNQPEWLGLTVVYKYFDYGTMDLPRHPIYKCVRHPADTPEVPNV